LHQLHSLVLLQLILLRYSPAEWAKLSPQAQNEVKRSNGRIKAQRNIPKAASVSGSNEVEPRKKKLLAATITSTVDTTSESEQSDYDD
jgi:hypothetical protein